MKNSTLNQSKTLKVSFKHDKSKLLFFDTFIYQKQIHYIAQCESKKVFVGNASNGNFEIQWEGLIKEKIKCINLMWKQNVLWVGTISGNILGVDFMHQQLNNTEEGYRSYQVKQIDNKPIVGLVALKQGQDRVLVSFSQDGTLRKFINQNLIKTVKLKGAITKFRANKSPRQPELDFFCAFIIKDFAFPFILSIETILAFFDSETSIDQYCQEYFTHYKDIKEEFHQREPSFIELSDTENILVLVYNQQINVYFIKRQNNIFKAYLDFQFLAEYPLISIDLVETSLAYSQSSGISMYNLAARKKITRNMKVSSQKIIDYNIILWGKVDEYLLYGFINQKSKVIFHTVKKL